MAAPRAQSEPAPREGAKSELREHEIAQQNYCIRVRISVRHSGLAKGPRSTDFVIVSFARNGEAVAGHAVFHSTAMTSWSKPEPFRGVLFAGPALVV